MDDENASCAHDGEENAQLSLLNLPMEIFLHICSFLDARTVVHSLSLVCKQLYQILNADKSLWKARFNYIWPYASYSLLRPVTPGRLFWLSSCVTMKKQTALWKQQDSIMKLINMHPNYITSVLLMHGGTTCIGGTQRALVYWKRETPSYEIGDTIRIDLMSNRGSSYGWINGLTAIDNTIYTCGCDLSVRSFMLTNTGFVHHRTYELSMPNEVLSISSCPERALFAIGSSFGTIYVFDSRSSNKPISQYRRNTRTVNKLVMNTEYITSSSMDKTVSVWDQRAGRIMKSVTIPGEALPASMSMRRDWVCVGDHKAKLHMLNLNNDFELVKSYSTEHTEGITGLRLTRGCLITSSRDTVRILSLNDPPKHIATLRSNFGILSIDYLNDILAISGRGIEMWRPKN